MDLPLSGKQAVLQNKTSEENLSRSSRCWVASPLGACNVRRSLLLLLLAATRNEILSVRSEFI